MTKGGVLIGVGVNSTVFRPSQNRPLFLFFYTVCCFSVSFLLMSWPCPKGSVCFWALNDWPRGKQWILFPRDPLRLGEHWSRGKEKSLITAAPVIRCFVIPSQLKTRKIECEEIVCFTPAGSQFCRGFKEHDLITCKSKIQVVVSLGS